MRLGAVRKHRAPKGALRREFVSLTRPSELGQKAPSAKRCIKTVRFGIPSRVPFPSVRKHRAPKGALRLSAMLSAVFLMPGQKAPSAKRCIKTSSAWTPPTWSVCQKAPSAKRCIKTGVSLHPHQNVRNRQKAPSAKRCIKT